MEGRLCRVMVMLLLGVFPAFESARAATFIVDNAGNGGDAVLGDGNCATAGAVCTLRAAIQEANALAGPDDIHFNLGGGGAQTIVLGSALPTITTVVTIDGTTQPGFVSAPPFAPIIELNAAAGGASTLHVIGAGSSGTTIRGLCINRGPGSAIRIVGSSNNVVAGNFLGTNLAGTAAGPGNQVGVFIGASAVATNNNRIGGTAPADRNVISGNTVDGIQIFGGSGGATNNLVQGNYIGVDVNGASPVGNTNQGVALFTGNTNANNVIGGTAPGAGNLISGNGNDGILITNVGTTGTVVQGNRLGTDAAGTAPIPNFRGVEIAVGASGNIIGGPPGSQNVISGNTAQGILIDAANNNTVSRALIGTDQSGGAKIPNGQHGIEIVNGSSGNTIGGISGTGNVISGNAFSGVNVLGSAGNSILGNLIGLDLAGNAILNNGQFGVAVAQGATGNTIGDPTGGNVISGNDQAGVRIVDDGTNNNVVQSNLIGLDASGSLPRPNLAEGVILDTGGVAMGNRIGGVGFTNVISGNNGPGIRILNGMMGTLVVDNIIGRNATNSAAVANGGGGVLIDDSSGNTVGGTGPSDGNIIAGNNNGDGVAVVGTATGNAILGNAIFSNAGLGIDLGPDGITANDAGDVDGGPNALMNFPVTNAVLESGGTVTVHFMLDLQAGSYRVEFFKNPSGADGSGNGEGELFAGSTVIAHAGGGFEFFNYGFPGAVGDVITATTTLCTDGPACAAPGGTSEFGAARAAVTTEVELISFDATPGNGRVALAWRTGSELHNLGFHLYRALDEAGPYGRITEALIPGLGSSPTGRSYSFTDSGLTNGVRYFYQLEDIETSGRTERHGPVSAVPDESGESEEPERAVYGDPSNVSLRVVERGSRGAVIELVTGGLFATAQADGTVLLEVPGFEELELGEGSVAVPVKRTWLEVLAGRKVSIASVRAFEEASLPGLRPASARVPEIVATPGGAVRAGHRRAPRDDDSRGVVPVAAARIVETGFQADVKKALVELAPLRWDGGTRTLHWARRLEVHLVFAGNEPTERSLGGSRGRRQHRDSRRREEDAVIARLSTKAPGLYRLPLEELVGSRAPRTRTAPRLRLSHRGESVPFHLSSNALYFLGVDDAVYELETGSHGPPMPVIDAAPSSSVSVSSYEQHVELEENRYYQPGLLEAPSPWFWDFLISPSAKSYPFRLGSLLDRDAELELFLHGASDFEGAPDHRVKVFLNGHGVGEALWDGKVAMRFVASLAPGVLREGENELSLENSGSGAAPYSMVFLDRFTLSYRRLPVAEEGVLEGRFTEPGVVSVEALPAGSFVVQTLPETAWLEGVPNGSFQVEAGWHYLAVSPNRVLKPEVRMASAPRLRSGRNQADYLLIGPRELLPAATPLLNHRARQGLASRGVAIEDVYDEFGYGEAGPEPIRAFIAYAFHHWAGPSPRYIVLLGDATYDPQDHLGTGVADRVPTWMRKTSYLLTASDPTYAAVHGDDALPDVALGRLPAATLGEARTLVEKVLEYEESLPTLSRRAVLVADDGDAAGDFEADSEAIAELLSGREVERIFLSEHGTAGTRRAIVESLDRGAFLMSYVGHGGIGLWAGENVFENRDIDSLSPQASQPILLTMNCLNGYFHFPYFDALGEAFVKARYKGAIAAFSPSGLSLDGPAHLYHQALVTELTSGRHGRLGDAVLAAQATYAESGIFPELIGIYHLLGDPALRLR